MLSLLFLIAFSPREIATVSLHSNGNDSVYPQTSTSNVTGRWISSFSLRAPNSTAEMVIYTNDRSSLEWNRARLWDIFFNPVAVRNISLFRSTLVIDNVSIIYTSFLDDSWIKKLSRSDIIRACKRKLQTVIILGIRANLDDGFQLSEDINCPK